MKNIKSLFAVALGAAIFIQPLIADEHKHGGHEAHGGHMLEGYLKVSEALFKDDLAGAKKAAWELVDHDSESSLAASAEKISEAGDLDTAREGFKELSAKAITMAAAHKENELIVMQCPMVKGGGGVWLSADSSVNNPYFGARMPHCGGPKK